MFFKGTISEVEQKLVLSAETLIRQLIFYLSFFLSGIVKANF